MTTTASAPSFVVCMARDYSAPGCRFFRQTLLVAAARVAHGAGLVEQAARSSRRPPGIERVGVVQRVVGVAGIVEPLELEGAELEPRARVLRLPTGRAHEQA